MEGSQSWKCVNLSVRNRNGDQDPAPSLSPHFHITPSGPCSDLNPTFWLQQLPQGLTWTLIHDCPIFLTL